MEKKKTWNERISIISAFVAIAVAITYVARFSAWAQESSAESAVKCRAAHFTEDHKPVYDSLKKLRNDVDTAIAKTNKIILTTENMYYLMMEIASPDQKTRAQNKMQEAKNFGVQ